MKQILILFFFVAINIQLIKGQNQSKVFNFPIKPGTKEWAKLNTYEERIGAYNIPNNLLQIMNTEDLVQTCLNYPELRLIMTRNSLQQGYDYLKSIFNGFEELEKRKNAGTQLLKVYKKLNPANITEFDTPVKRGEFAFQFTYIEIIVAQKIIILNLSKIEIKELIKRTISNYESIEKLPEHYSTFGLTTPALVLGRLLDVNTYPDFIAKKSKDDKLKNFVDYTYLGNRSTLSDIIAVSKEYLKQLENE